MRKEVCCVAGSDRIKNDDIVELNIYAIREKLNSYKQK
jgi:hypothetical protein